MGKLMKYYRLGSGGVYRTTKDFWDSDADATRIPPSEGLAEMQAEAKAWLLKSLAPGDTVYTVLRHVSASGMRQRIDLYAIRGNRLECLSGFAAALLGEPPGGDKPGIVVNGGGQDMGYDLVYRLSSVLFHGQDRAGYVLKHRWI